MVRALYQSNVAIVYPIPFGDHGSIGGGERYAYQLAQALARVAPTRYISFANESLHRKEPYLEVKIHRAITYARKLRNNPVSIGFLADLRDVDVIHCLSWHTIVTDLCVVFAAVTGKKVFVTDVGGGGSISLASKVPLARYVDGYLLLSQFATRLTPPEGNNAAVIYGGVDTNQFAPGPRLREAKVVFLGRLLPHKGIDYLIEAIDDDVLLKVIGRPYDVDYFRMLRGLAGGKRVEFITDADDARVVSELRTATVAVMPSVYVTRNGLSGPAPELFGLAAAEAMSCATPVIATNVGALSEVVADQVTGWVIPPNDVKALSAAIKSAMDDPARASSYGAAGRQRVKQHFTWTAVAERCLNAYSDTRRCLLAS